MSDDLSNFSMDELFRAEAEMQCASLAGDLLALEKEPNPLPLLENLMRAAHSLKGAARIVGRGEAVRVAHVMEDCFVQLQKKKSLPSPETVDVLLQGADLLRQLAGVSAGTPSPEEIEAFLQVCANPGMVAPGARLPAAPAEKSAAPPAAQEKRDVRLDSERLDNLLALAGQAVVASRPDGSGDSLRAAMRRLQSLLVETAKTTDPHLQSTLLRRALVTASSCQSTLAEEGEARDLRERRLAQLCTRIYNQTLACRLRPFADIVPGLKRLARDLARELKKEVEVEIEGETTEVDRDLLDRLDGPLAHLIRNSLDHGLETPEDRQRGGKPKTGVLSVEVRSQGGWLIVRVGDDGRGVSNDLIRAAIVRRSLASPENLQQMSDSELSEFLLLPGFSLSERVTEISGRGVGLDAVRAMVYGAGGSLRIHRPEGGGFACEMILPISLSLIRALVFEVAEGSYAVPLSRIERVVEVPVEEVHAIAGRQHIYVAQERVEVVSAAEILELGEAPAAQEKLPILILQGGSGKVAVMVDRFLGIRQLSLQRLDPSLGKVQDVSAAAVLDDGQPVVVLDVDDLTVTAANFSTGSRYRPMARGGEGAVRSVRRILVADDSLTVRELERKLLANHGYAVETAVDGADAWNSLRAGSYDLLVTDIDMPRMDGIELVRLIRADARLRDLPVVVVSYKDRPEDRARGLEAGADFYLPKSSYEDESLLRAARELIGEAIPA